MGRFEYIEYDKLAKGHQLNARLDCENLEKLINEILVSPRSKALALTKLEEVYMWIGKGIRDDQIARNDKTVR